ncbi:MAG: hypothetical protein KF891_23500 [Rhizobacter sp.]|nr:hypothetical protein [Rhizobacter sp.]
MRAWITRLVVTLLACGGIPTLAWGQEGTKVSVAAYIADGRYAAYEKVAQARAEELLADSKYVVLDEAKARKLKKGWVDLADPGHVITAEEFVKRAGQYDIKKMVRVGVNVSVKPVLGLFYTATATAEIRIVDKSAKVQAFTLDGMGTRGVPPSDGLTEGAAVSNAIQRAIDGAAQRAGLTVVSPALAKGVPLALEAVTSGPPDAELAPASADVSNASWVAGAKLARETWRGEDKACIAQSPDGQVGAVGGYTWAVNRLGGMTRTYGGRVHLIDTASSEEFNLHTVHPVGTRESGENGTSAPIACAFVGNWRYLVVATGNVLSCYDVERGAETCRLKLAGAPKTAQLSVGRVGNGAFVGLQADTGKTYYRVVVAK